MRVRIKECLVCAAIVVAIAPCISCLAWTALARRVATADLILVEVGMSKEEVLAFVGPTNHEECGGKYWAYYTKYDIFAPFYPMYVMFNEDGKVVARFS